MTDPYFSSKESITKTDHGLDYKSVLSKALEDFAVSDHDSRTKYSYSDCVSN